MIIISIDLKDAFYLIPTAKKNRELLFLIS